MYLFWTRTWTSMCYRCVLYQFFFCSHCSLCPETDVRCWLYLCVYANPCVWVFRWLSSLLLWPCCRWWSIFMVNMLYNPVLAPSLCGKCFSSTFTAASVSNHTVLLRPSFSFLSFFFPLSTWHTIAFWVRHSSVSAPLFPFSLSSPIHPCLLYFSFSILCGTKPWVYLWLCACACVCLLCAHTAAEERETTWQ